MQQTNHRRTRAGQLRPHDQSRRSIRCVQCWVFLSGKATTTWTNLSAAATRHVRHGLMPRSECERLARALIRHLNQRQGTAHLPQSLRSHCCLEVACCVQVRGVNHQSVIRRRRTLKTLSPTSSSRRARATAPCGPACSSRRSSSPPSSTHEAPPHGAPRGAPRACTG